MPKKYSCDLPSCFALHTLHYYFFIPVLSSLIPHCQVKEKEIPIPFVWVFCCWFVCVCFFFSYQGKC